MSVLRRLNDRGIERLLEFIHNVKSNPNLAPPFEILEHAETSDDLGDLEIVIEPRIFGSRFTAGEYLYSLITESGLEDVERDRGLWSWLSLYFFEELCPKDKKGNRKPGEDARWIPDLGRKYYRHLLLNPYQIFKAFSVNPQDAMIILYNPLHTPGEMVGQLASRMDLVRNRALLGAATQLYLREDRSALKAGGPTTTVKINGKTRGRPGTVHRLVDVYKQFDSVWDLYAMNPAGFLGLLPKEFDRFRGN